MWGGTERFCRRLSASHTRGRPPDERAAAHRDGASSRRQMQSCSFLARARIEHYLLWEFLSIFSFTKNKFKVFSAKNAGVLSLSLSLSFTRYVTCYHIHQHLCCGMFSSFDYRALSREVMSLSRFFDFDALIHRVGFLAASSSLEERREFS